MKATWKLFVLGVSVAILWQFAPTKLQAGDCDGQACCQGGCECETCCTSGLLDTVDSLLGRIHKQVNRTSRAVFSEFGIRHSMAIRKCDSACDVGCSGCDSCSLSTAVHGNRLGSSSRTGCKSCQEGAYAVDSTIDDSLGSQPVPPPMAGSLRSQSSRILTKREQEQPLTRPEPSTRPRPVKAPAGSSSVPSDFEQPQKLPDSQVDPFEDESQTNSPFQGAGRFGKPTVPGKTIQYRRNSKLQGEAQQQEASQPALAPSYRQRFDPQANHSADSADYWAGSDEAVSSERNRVELASDQVTALQQIHKRAYSLKLADQIWSSSSDSQSVEEVDDQVEADSAPARLPKGTSSAQPLKVPVRPVLRLKAQPATGIKITAAPFDNPLR